MRTSNLQCEVRGRNVLLALEEMVFQGMIDRLIEIGICYGMEISGEKQKVMRISRRPSALEIMIESKTTEE